MTISRCMITCHGCKCLSIGTILCVKCEYHVRLRRITWQLSCHIIKISFKYHITSRHILYFIISYHIISKHNITYHISIWVFECWMISHALTCVAWCIDCARDINWKISLLTIFGVGCEGGIGDNARSIEDEDDACGVSATIEGNEVDGVWKNMEYGIWNMEHAIQNMKLTTCTMWYGMMQHVTYHIHILSLTNPCVVSVGNVVVAASAKSCERGLYNKNQQHDDQQC